MLDTEISSKLPLEGPALRTHGERVGIDDRLGRTPFLLADGALVEGNVHVGLSQFTAHVRRNLARAV